MCTTAVSQSAVHKQVRVPTRMRSSGGRFMCTRPRSHRGKRQHCSAHFTAPEERCTDEPISARIWKCLVRSVSSLDVYQRCLSRCSSQAGACAHSNAFLGRQNHVHTPSFSSRETPALLRPLHCPRGMADACIDDALLLPRTNTTCPIGGGRRISP